MARRRVPLRRHAGRARPRRGRRRGGFWVALLTGGAVRHYTADGVLDAVVEVPAAQTTACALGGTRLYVTTSSRDIDPDDEPLAGAVFVAEVGDVAAPGVPVRPYAG